MKQELYLGTIKPIDKNDSWRSRHWTDRFTNALFNAMDHPSWEGKVYRRGFHTAPTSDQPEIMPLHTPESLNKITDSFRDILLRYNEYNRWIQHGMYFNPQGLHGPDHIKRVLLLSLTMSRIHKLSLRQEQILVFCSLYHDIGRKHDGVDPRHGLTSSKNIIDIKNRMELDHKEDFPVASMIIRHHSVDDRLAAREQEKQTTHWNSHQIQLLKKLFPLFKDADNLDRVRVNDLDYRYLRHEESLQLSGFATKLYLHSKKYGSNWNSFFERMG